MAHQIEILMLPDDVASLERDLEQLKFLVIPSELKEPQLVTEAGFQIRKFGEENLTVYLARQEDLPFVVVRPSGNVKVWTIDDLRSPVIQFHRCFFDGKILRKGRFFYTKSWFGSDRATVQKNEAFLEWSRQVFAIVRRTLSRDAARSIYLGCSAKQWLVQNRKSNVNE